MTSTDSAIAKDLAGAHCVVTGGLGFIGSNVVRHLQALGSRVTVVDALIAEHGGSPTNVPPTTPVLIADIGDPAVADVVERM